MAANASACTASSEPEKFCYENDKVAQWIAAGKVPFYAFYVSDDLVRPHHIVYAVYLESPYEMIETLVDALRPTYHNHPMLDMAMHISTSRGDDTEYELLKRVNY